MERTAAKTAFANVLVNTLIANVTTSFLWFALTFWVYIQTQSVLATGIIGGAYMLSQNTEAQNRALERATEGRLKILQAQKKQLEEYTRLDPENNQNQTPPMSSRRSSGCQR